MAYESVLQARRTAFAPAAAAVAAAAPRSPPLPPPETEAPVWSWEEQAAAMERSWGTQHEEEYRRYAELARALAELEVPPKLCNAVRFCLPPARWPGKNLQQRARAAWAEVLARGVGRHPKIATLDEHEVWALLGGALCEDCRRPRPFAPYWDGIVVRSRALGEEDATRAAAVVEICRTLQALLALDGGDGRGRVIGGGGGHATVAVTAAAASPSSAEAAPGGAGGGAPRRRRNRRHRRRPAT